MRKNLLVSPTHFDMDYLRYEITKISGGKCFWHFQGGNDASKIVI